MPVEVAHGQTPLIVALPHVGSHMPQTVSARLAEAGRSFSDTDRYLDRLVGGLDPLPSHVRARFSRCVSDAEVSTLSTERNHPKSGYVGVVPLLDRTGGEIWSKQPTPHEAAQWQAAYYAPFHAALSAEIAYTRARHQRAVIATLHTLPDEQQFLDWDIVISTDLKTPYALTASTQFTRFLQSAGQYRCLLTGMAPARWITRHHSKPDLSVYTFQINIRSSCYTKAEGEARAFDASKAAPLQDFLAGAFQVLIDHLPD